MKRTLHNRLMFSVLFLLAACSGSDPNTPPPPAASADGQKELKQLQTLAAAASQTCCQSAAPYMIQVGKALFTPNPAQNAPTSEPNMSSCQQAIMNFEMLFRTIDNGAYANRQDAQQWRQAQGAGVVNCVGSQMQNAGLPVNPQTLPMYFAAAQSLSQKLQNAVPSLQADGRRFVNSQSALGGGGGGYGLGGSPRGIASNPYATSQNPWGYNPYGLTSGSGLGTNPYGSGTNYTSTTPQLASTFGAPNFLNPNAANQIFVQLPNIPAGY